MASNQSHPPSKQRHHNKIHNRNLPLLSKLKCKMQHHPNSYHRLQQTVSKAPRARKAPTRQNRTFLIHRAHQYADRVKRSNHSRRLGIRALTNLRKLRGNSTLKAIPNRLLTRPIPPCQVEDKTLDPVHQTVPLWEGRHHHNQ